MEWAEAAFGSGCLSKCLMLSAVFSRKLPQASMTQEQKPLARFLWSAFRWDPSPEISTVIAGQGNQIIS